nr:hypothetical protein [Tanacetum cinerariifolium]
MNFIKLHQRYDVVLIELSTPNCKSSTLFSNIVLRIKRKSALLKSFSESDRDHIFYTLDVVPCNIVIGERCSILLSNAKVFQDVPKHKHLLGLGVDQQVWLLELELQELKRVNAPTPTLILSRKPDLIGDEFHLGFELSFMESREDLLEDDIEILRRSERFRREEVIEMEKNVVHI